MKRVTTLQFCASAADSCALLSQPGWAQASDKSRATENLPSAPAAAITRAPSQVALCRRLQPRLMASSPVRDASAVELVERAPCREHQHRRPSFTVRLTRTQAEQLALKNNPRISVGRSAGAGAAPGLSRDPGG